MICTNCGQVTNGKTAVKGNIAIEIVLWLFFIIPGIIYSLWRSSSRHKVCPVCGSTNLVPIDTPNGKHMLEQQGKTMEQAQTEAKESAPMAMPIKIVIGVVVFFVVIFIIGWFM